MLLGGLYGHAPNWPARRLPCKFAPRDSLRHTFVGSSPNLAESTRLAWRSWSVLATMKTEQEGCSHVLGCLC